MKLKEQLIRSNLNHNSAGFALGSCLPFFNVEKGIPAGTKYLVEAIPYSGGLDSVMTVMQHAARRGKHKPHLLYWPSIKEKDLSKIEDFLFEQVSNLGYLNMSLALEPQLGTGHYSTAQMVTRALRHRLNLKLTGLNYAQRAATVVWAHENDIRYLSCDHPDHEWCGECFPCFEEETYRRMFGTTTPSWKPIKISSKNAVKYVTEVMETEKTKVDRWYGDNFDILFAMQIKWCTLQQIWPEAFK